MGNAKIRTNSGKNTQNKLCNETKEKGTQLVMAKFNGEMGNAKIRTNSGALRKVPRKILNWWHSSFLLQGRSKATVGESSGLVG